MSRGLAVIAVIAAGLLAGGCASEPKAWEKGKLALEDMTMGGDPLEKGFTEHILASKQAASGGYGVGGGGCGCN